MYQHCKYTKDIQSNIENNTINMMKTIDCIYELIENDFIYDEDAEKQIVIAICNDNIEGIRNPHQNWILQSLQNILNGELQNKNEYLYYKACRITGFVCNVINRHYYQLRPAVICDYILNGIQISKILHHSIFALEEMGLWAILEMIRLYNETEIQTHIVPLLTEHQDKRSFLSTIIKNFEHISSNTNAHFDDVYSSASTNLLWTLLNSTDSKIRCKIVFKTKINQILYLRMKKLQMYLSNRHRLPSIIHYEVNLTLLIKIFMARVELTKTCSKNIKPEQHISEHDLLIIHEILSNFKFIRSSNTIDVQYMQEIGMSPQSITTIAEFCNIILQRIIDLQCWTHLQLQSNTIYIQHYNKQQNVKQKVMAYQCGQVLKSSNIIFTIEQISTAVKYICFFL